MKSPSSPPVSRANHLPSRRLSSRTTTPSRRPRRRPGLYGPALLALLLAGCGVLSPEEQLLTDFFEASRLHDTTVAAKVSDVIFSPAVDGIVDRFEIERVEQ